VRFLVAAGFAILIVATAKTVDVLQNRFGSQLEPPLTWPPTSHYPLPRLASRSRAEPSGRRLSPRVP